VKLARHSRNDLGTTMRRPYHLLDEPEDAWTLWPIPVR